jgi:5-methylcytosine-specific restriction protein B
LDYFTKQHFDLLAMWQGKKSEPGNAEQDAIKAELKEAYELIERWAYGVEKACFPNGVVKLRKSPINQGGKFFPYLWAKIYPAKDSPEGLAYTVHIREKGFVVKIDTVGAKPKIRQAYEALIGDDNNSPIVRILPIEAGLQLDLAQLITWSCEQISTFGLSYQEVVDNLGFEKNPETGNQAHNYLFSWNPNNWPWDNMQQIIDKTRNGESTVVAWRCSSKKIVQGDLAWMMRLGVGIKLKGVMAKGNVVSSPYMDKHWNEEKANAGEQCSYVDIAFTDVRNVFEDDFVTNEQLADITADKQQWSPQSSGIEIKSNSAIQLQDLWDLTTNSIAEQPSNYGSADQGISMNQILYGPPGTGKTYHSIEAAVKAAEPEFKPISTNLQAQRKEIKAEYDRLTKDKRIRFVTFHQSYGYEEFVEGLKANSELGQISYDVEPGVFKQICEDAISNQHTITIADVGNDFEACWERFLNDFDVDGMLITTKKSSFTVTAVNDKTIYFDKSHGDSIHTLSISTLKQVFNGEKTIKGGLNVYYLPLITHLKTLAKTIPVKNKIRKNFVLVVDEINRGNISKIFGELITLIEPSKRSGERQTEALEVILPNSGERFAVPDNLYIIGTMNTADRSLAMMDTALRRRFDFVEMMPEPELFKDTRLVKGINLELLLRKMNERIEVLYDREHTLGHAFLIPVANKADDQEAAFTELKLVFRNKIIPLLEEYFFEDWQKIRLVLGDNQKANASDLQFISETELEYTALFGHSYQPNGYHGESKVYQLAAFNDDNSAWHHPESYIEIYQSGNNSQG